MAGLAVGVVFALATSNILAGAGIGLLCGGLGFSWSAVKAPGLLAVAVVVGCIAWAFLSAVVLTAAPINDPSAPGGYQPHDYACGRVITHPFSNPTASWRAEDQSQVAQGAENPGDTGVFDDCSSRFRHWRINGFVLAGIAILFGCWAAWPLQKGAAQP
jgi:hypothetical protein